jgi:hypothetical protein
MAMELTMYVWWWVLQVMAMGTDNVCMVVGTAGDGDGD